MNIIFIDIETTGLNEKEDYIIEIAAIHHPSGDEFHSLVKPSAPLTYRHKDIIEKVSKIPLEELEKAPDVESVAIRFQTFLFLHLPYDHLSGWNHQFDSRFLSLPPWNIHTKNWSNDVMYQAMPNMGRSGALAWNPRYESYKWPRLEEAKAFFCIEEEAHRALGDIRATRKIWELTKDDQPFKTGDTIIVDVAEVKTGPPRTFRDYMGKRND